MRHIPILGAPSVGRCTLMKKLMESNPRHYGVPVRRMLMEIDNGLIDMCQRYHTSYEIRRIERERISLHIT